MICPGGRKIYLRDMSMFYLFLCFLCFDPCLDLAFRGIGDHIAGHMAGPHKVHTGGLDFCQISSFIKTVGVNGTGVVHSVLGIGVHQGDFTVADDAVPCGEIDRFIFRWSMASQEPFAIHKIARFAYIAVGIVFYLVVIIPDLSSAVFPNHIGHVGFCIIIAVT